jgi:hypothetical protein
VEAGQVHSGLKVITLTDDIVIHKGLIVLLLGIFIALAAAVYVTNGAPQAGASISVPLAQDAPNPAPGAALVSPPAQAQLQPSVRGGCGCGGGGLSCGGGGVSAPDPSKAVLVNTSNGSLTGNAQDIYIKALSDGTYDKQELDVKKGVPVRLHFTADSDAGCGRSMVIYGLNIRATSQNGQENVVEFIPQQEGTYEISCGMRMWGPAKLVVTS